jgi:hydrogenase expression/formation protein HypC
MCLAIPGKIRSINDNDMAEVDILGVTRTASIAMTPEAKVDDYVLIHAGYAIQVVDEQYANETLELLKEMGDAEEFGEPAFDIQSAAEAS